MSLVVQCPFCPAKVKLPATAVRATCPKCLHSFDARSAGENAAPEAEEEQASSAGIMQQKRGAGVVRGKPPVKAARRPVDEDEDDEESSLPEWINLWGVI